jgi:tRNA dimethylallyltransferase
MAPLVVIVGPTASGKSAAAIEFAEKYNGEIICADSRTIYKGMDIGTAKPSIEDQGRVPHWALDLVTPGERFTVADFKTYAIQKIAEIRARGHVPMLVGGTGLYVDAIILDYQFGPPADTAMREMLEQKTLQELHEYCQEHNIKLPENDKNKRYIIRAIENRTINNSSGTNPIDNTIIVGIATEKETLRKRIALRTTIMFAQGVLREADSLANTYGWDNEAMTGSIYRLIRKYRSNEINENQLHRQNETADWHLAKRQLTWLKRRGYIQWMPLEQVVSYLSDRLAYTEKK